MIDVAERVFCAVCKNANLFARNCLINEELAQGDRPGNTFKNLKLCSDHIQLTMKPNLGHDVVLSGSDRPLQGGIKYMLRFTRRRELGSEGSL